MNIVISEGGKPCSTPHVISAPVIVVAIATMAAGCRYRRCRAIMLVATHISSS